MAKWKIIESSNGGYIAELASEPAENQPYWGGIGFMMGRMVYESAHFNTRGQAEKYIERRGIPLCMR